VCPHLSTLAGLYKEIPDQSANRYLLFKKAVLTSNVDDDTCWKTVENLDLLEDAREEMMSSKAVVPVTTN
jgi:hypothetical protein